ncbi:RNA polymerase II transcription elongation factor-domain-containing protein [Amylocystis lapponica]|nr:RNA polymerase II transcription elongation factor-domain-containing protein [Amylocystis lapponica]
MSTNSWMPLSGRHSVTIGTSLGRTLKARRGGPAPKNKLPDRDFYSFRYNFKPESVDSTKAGTIEAKKGKDTTNVSVERASTQTGEGGHVFVGTEQPAREWDCVLIYDEEMGTFTLEKLDSYMNLTYDRKTKHAPRHAGSPLPPPPPARITASSSSSSTLSQPVPSTKADVDHLVLEAALERDSGLEDAEGEIDDEIAAILPSTPLPSAPPLPAAKSHTAQGITVRAKHAAANSAASTPLRLKREALKMEEEEESEGEIVEGRTQPRVHPPDPPPAQAPPKAPPPAARAPARAKSSAKPAAPPPTSAPRPRPSQPAQPPAAKAQPAAPAPAPSKKREYGADVEEETLEFGRPSRPLPAKRARPSPPPPPPPPPQPQAAQPFSLALPGGPAATAPVGLSFPGSSSATTAPVGLSFPGSSSAAVSLPPAAPADDSDNEDWDEVQPGALRAIEMEEIVPTATAEEEEEEEEIDMNAFEAELNQAVGEDAPAGMEEEEDFLAGAVSPVAERATGVDWGDEDDYSSSEDSEED